MGRRFRADGFATTGDAAGNDESPVHHEPAPDPAVPGRRTLLRRLFPVTALALLLASTAAAQSPAPVRVATDLSTFPVEGNETWQKIGAAPVLHFEGRLVCNDNRPDAYVAFQGLLGEIDAAHAIEVRASMDVISNLGGLAGVLEISRPGLELVVQLHPDRIDVTEREGRRLRWLATAPADLSEESELVVRRESSLADPRETLTVSVDGVEILRTAGNARGTLGVGRVVFGSLGYNSMGATRWSRIEVDAITPDVDPAVPTDVRSFGRLKAAFDR